MATGDLTNLATALAWLGLTTDTGGIVAQLITAMSTQIQTFLGYQLASSTYTRNFNGTGGAILLLPDRPVTAVASVMVDGISIPSAAIPNDGFVFDTKFLYLTQSSRFCSARFNRGFQNVAVTYTAGYTTIPADLVQACLAWIKTIYDSIDYSSAVAMLRAGDTQISFTNYLTELNGQTLLVPPSIASALLPYRRIAL